MMDQEGPDLWQRVTTPEALQAAWWKVKSNEGSAGGDGVGLGEFGGDLFANLTQLRAELLGGTYRTGPFRKVSIPKKKPGYRILAIPSIRDRVVHTSIASALTPIFEAEFEDGSFGYRPNRGVVHAVERIERWRKRGYDVVIEADIVSFFDNVDHEMLREKIASVIRTLPGAPPLMALIETILEAEGKALGTPGRGLVQGSPLSPLLSNLYLDALDEEIEAQAVKIVRFGDDFVILCKSQKKAEKVLAHCVRVLADHHLQLHEAGTRIVSFDKGFDFIGYLFLRSLALKQKSPPAAAVPAKAIKSTVTDEGIIELDSEGSVFDPGKRVLYVLDPNHRLATRNRSFSVQRDDGSELIAIPHKRVGRIEIGPGVAFERAPLDLALGAGIDLALVDGYGQTKGCLAADNKKRAAIQFAQAAAICDPAFRTVVARSLVEARIRNQRTQLMRLNRERQHPDVETALGEMKQLLRKLPAQQTVDGARGIEGAATAAYWPALGAVVAKSSGRPFRRSRPARDPLNATINYMTAILERDLRAAIHSVGLHTGFAFLHSSRDRHDGLIYDFMEPFRAPLSEGLPVYLFNARRLRDDMFSDDVDGRTEISKPGRRAIIGGYEAAVAKRISRGDGGGKLTWRAMMRHQARGLVHAVVDAEPSRFAPYVMDA